MIIWKKLDIENALNIKLALDQSDFGKVEFNSKAINKNDIFIALKEGAGDGHDYVQNALDNGAALAIVERYIGKNQDRQILVKNCLEALYKLAEYKRKKTKAKIIAVTGSLGKTSFKEILGKMLQSFGRVFASYKNFNNYIGVPLNLASMPDDTEYAIYEVGMNHSNEITPIVKLLKPDISVITSIAPVHIENFDSLQGIVDAKLEIFDSFTEHTGVAILNTDNSYADYMFDKLKGKGLKTIYSFGKSKNNSAQYLNYTQSFDQSNFDVQIAGSVCHCMTRMCGTHHASNITGAALLISILGLNVNKALDSINNLTPFEGRGNIFNISLNGKNLIVINDAYNASPDSIKASLANYKYFDVKNKALILGDMRELGQHSIKYHQDLSEFVIDSQANLVVMVGDHMKYLYEKLKDEKIESYHFADLNDAILNISQILSNSDSVLIKASNGMKFSEIILYLKNL